MPLDEFVIRACRASPNTDVALGLVLDWQVVCTRSFEGGWKYTFATEYSPFWPSTPTPDYNNMFGKAYDTRNTLMDGKWTT